MQDFQTKVYRQWKSDGSTYPLPMTEAVRRVRLREKLRTPEEVEADLRAGKILESPCARFSVDPLALGVA